jgi:hypothetical protein
VFAIAVCALIAVSGAAAASEATVQWPMFGFDTARQGRSPTRFPDSVLGKEWSTPPPRTLYQYTGGTPYWSEPCVGVVEGKGRVFIGCYDNNLYAFNARTGEEAWVFTAPILIGGCGAPGPLGGIGTARIDAALTPRSVETRRSGADMLYRLRFT